MISQDLINSKVAQNYQLAITHDPSVVATFAVKGTIAIGVGDSAVGGKLWQKQDNDLTTNWTLVGGGSPGGVKLPYRWFDIEPQDGFVLPITRPRAYYPSILYNSTPIFNDGANLRKYVAYYGTSQGYIAFSDDGISWDTETLVTGVVGVAYHASIIIVSGIIHLFYWDTTVSVYTPGATRHATFNPAISCAASISDAPLTGTYIVGGPGGGNIRAGTYGVNQAFYNPAPTNNPADPYSYQWCIIHNGSDGSQEGVLFATSPDGLNFSAYNGLTEVIPRGAVPAWDEWIGTLQTFIDSNGLWHGFYSGGLGTLAGEDTNFGGGLGYATSLDGITWVKWDKNPLIRKTESFKSWKRLYTSWVIKDAAGYKMYFTCKSNAGDYRVTYAIIDGFV